MSQYYRLVRDIFRGDGWTLRGPTNSYGDWVEPQLFLNGAAITIHIPLFYEVAHAGVPLSFNMTPQDVPVVTDALGATLSGLAPSEVQRVEVAIKGVFERYEIVNVTAVAACLDERRSLVTWWTAADGKPDRIGEYREVSNIRVDPGRTEGKHIFRLKGWSRAIIVSEKVKGVLEDCGATGILFAPV